MKILIKRLVSKAQGGGHKYVKREGTPGHYKYFYRLPDGSIGSRAQLNAATKGKKTEGGTLSTEKLSYKGFDIETKKLAAGGFLARVYDSSGKQTDSAQGDTANIANAILFTLIDGTKASNKNDFFKKVIEHLNTMRLGEEDRDYIRRNSGADKKQGLSEIQSNWDRDNPNSPMKFGEEKPAKEETQKKEKDWGGASTLDNNELMRQYKQFSKETQPGGPEEFNAGLIGRVDSLHNEAKKRGLIGDSRLKMATDRMGQLYREGKNNSPEMDAAFKEYQEAKKEAREQTEKDISAFIESMRESGDVKKSSANAIAGICKAMEAL